MRWSGLLADTWRINPSQRAGLFLMIAIVDCESSDTRGIQRAFERIGTKTAVVNSIDRLERASKIVIPPSASFPRMIRSLRDGGLVGPLLSAASGGRPVLAISRGMHLLFDVCYEEGQHTGLGLVHGKVIRFEFGEHPAARHFSLPHQGWNQVHWTNDCPLTAGLESGEYFYFHHSFHAEPLEHTDTGAQCNHGVDFSALIWKDRIFGTQFLPEKSEDAGLKLLANFAAL